MALISCSKDEGATSASNDIRFIGVIESGYDTRAIMTNDHKANDHNRIKWEIDDQVGIYCNEPNVKDKKSGIYSVSSVGNDGTAVFAIKTEQSGMKVAESYNYAVFPHDATFESGVFSYEIPATYTYKNIESVITKSLMVAKVAALDDGESTVELNFTKAQSILRLCFSAYDPTKYSDKKVKTIILESAENYLNGTAQVSWVNDDTPLSAVIESGTDENKKLTITLETPQTLTHYLDDDNHIEVYVPIVPTFFKENDLTITLLDESDTQIYSKKVGQAFNVARGSTQGLMHTLDKPDTPPVPDGATEVSDIMELETAISNGQCNLYLNDGDYIIQGNMGEAPYDGKKLTFTGSRNAIIKFRGGTRIFQDSEIVLNGITFDCRNDDGLNVNYRGSQVQSITFNDCKFIGGYSGHSGHYIFNNCYIDANNEGFCSYGANSMTFRNCIFYSELSRAIHLYKDGT